MTKKSNSKTFISSNRNILLNSLILKLIFAMLLSGCQGSDSDPIVLLAKQTITNPVRLGAESLEFASIKKNVFSRCTSCHEQYKTYTGVVRELAAITKTISLNRMPKSGGPLSAEQKEFLNRWIQSGAPEFADQVAQPIQIPLLEPTWKSIYGGVIAPKCLVCHNSLGQAKFLDFSNRDSVYNQRDRTFGGTKLINLENIDDSYLIQILSDQDEPMPPKWSNIPALSENEINIFKRWLALGLPE